jgi:uncharacterized protein
MKVLFASDLHGEKPLYTALSDLAETSGTEILAVGGDILPSLPGSKRYEDVLPVQKTFIHGFLLPLFDAILNLPSVRMIALIPGNWDLGYPEIFKKKRERVVDLGEGCFPLGNGYEFIGYPFVPPTPFRPKEYEKMDDRDAPWPPQKFPSYIRSPCRPDTLLEIDPYDFLTARKTIEDDLAKLPTPGDYRKALYMMHSPPFGTALDCVRGVGPGGSRSIKAFLQARQPLLSLHGHIHESPALCGTYFDRIGETLSINAGQFLSGHSSPLCAVTFETEDPWVTLTHTLLPRIGPT